MLPPASFLAVSISDVERIRKGQDSELLRYLMDEFPLEQGFTIVFHGRRPNLDLVANSVEEAQTWMRGLQLLVDLVASMDHQEQLEQYQPDGARVGAGLPEGVRCCRTKGIWKGCRAGSKWCAERQGPSMERVILKEKWMLASQSRGMRLRTQDRRKGREGKMGKQSAAPVT